MADLMADGTASAEEEFFDQDDDADIYETLDDTPMRIQEGLFIGSFMAEQNKPKLQQAGITHVLQVAEGLAPSHPSDFSYCLVPVMDVPGEDLIAHFEKSFKFIDEAIRQQGAVLVHCVAGVSRSSTVCIGWLMARHNMTYDDAFRLVHKARPWIMPNSGFKRQLELFQQIGCDTSKWRAWRHQQAVQPAALVVALSHLGLKSPELS